MNNHESSGVWLFHSHAYFDHAVPDRVKEARAFMDQVEEVFATDTHVNPSRFLQAPAGPHPCGSFEVVFTREAFTRYVSWLMFARPEHIDILIHPLTGSQALDHTARGLWLGMPIALDQAMLEAEDAKSAQTTTFVRARGRDKLQHRKRRFVELDAKGQAPIEEGLVDRAE